MPPTSLERRSTLGVLHVALGVLFFTWTVKAGFLTLASFAFGYGVCDGATIALRPAVIANYFAGPNLAAVTGLHYTSSVPGPLIGPAVFGYSVDGWNSAALCLVAAGYFFGAKPPRIRHRRVSTCAPQPLRRRPGALPVSRMGSSYHNRLLGRARPAAF